MACVSAPFLAVAILAFACSSETANTDVIHLDLSSARGRGRSRPWVYPGGTLSELASEERPAVFCTDSEFPNDFSCDLRAFYASQLWKTRSAPDIYDVIVAYEDPRDRNVTCRGLFQKAREERVNSPLRLSYSRVECKPSSRVGVPPFKLATAASLSVVLRKPDDYDFSCTFEFGNRGRVAKRTARGRRVRVVKFEHETSGCVSPIAIGRREGDEDGVSCVSDGRRCRPVWN